MDDNGNDPVECAGLKYDDRHPAKFLTAMVEFDKVDGDLKVQANGLDSLMLQQGSAIIIFKNCQK